ncbi:MAG: peptidoglycan synthetase [Bacteroidetes bacterium GWF2_38_335]|nr:MAG: peptidoglycan synthetase [Bacteroidetes bacterium GWF2_38_335]OFY80262.1 MAG: peptidoglycan synthetase [Bacteroidetes bacterium RIFOXYA12_FULL_38_20]HBS88732.1 peptidoglycan synthetase [Bacteroidales bacterium]
MKVHFIATGGAAMHNMAIALHKKGFAVTGSDDEIFDPAKTRLEKYGLLPENPGWFPEKITDDLDAIILGMHAREDNPELIKARELGLRIYSFPEYLYEATKDKTRVVIGGSHGKTTITAMIMHVLNYLKIDHDYMVGAQLEGFETMVKISDAPIAIFEGDEYLSSPIDRRPKFHLYKPNIALLSGIAWDHINVFPTFEIYVDQFRQFINLIEKDGSLVYFEQDENLQMLAKEAKGVKSISYGTPDFFIKDFVTYLKRNNQETPLMVFGEHNLQNIMGAMNVCKQLGIEENKFFEAISQFKGASKRLQLLEKNECTSIFLDFAHSPSKLMATTKAVKEQFHRRTLVACMELHTFSSLNEDFLSQYKGTMDAAEVAYVYFNPHTLEHKKMKEITIDQVAKAFSHKNMVVFNDSEKLVNTLKSTDWKNKNLLLMSSGNFSGIKFGEFARELICK